MTLENASYIATIIGSFALVGVIFQIFIAYRKLQADHERSRREKAVELIIGWSTTVQKEQTWARKLVEQFSAEQCRALYNQSSFAVSEELGDHLNQFFKVKTKQHKNGAIVLTEKQVIRLRWYVVTYANLMESILVSWQYSIVSREIIEDQFSFLFSVEKGHAALREFRLAAGGEKSFPATEIFANHIQEQRSGILKERANIA